MTRVLIVMGRSAGGIARHVAQCVSELDRNDLILDIAAPAGLPVEMPKPEIPLEIPDGPLGHRKARRRIAELLERGYDVVHAHGLRAGIDAGLAARSAGIPSMVTVHNLVQPEIAGPLKARVYSMAERLVPRYNDRVLAVSQQIADRLRTISPRNADRIELLHLGVAPPGPRTRSREEIRAALGIDAGEALIVTVARLAPQKALPVMFEAVARLGTPARLAVLGEGPSEEELRRVAAASGAEVEFLGFRRDVADHIAAADVFCLSSVWEGVPLAAQEAIALGVPVVSTAVGGMGELVEDRVSGRLVPKNDPASLAAALEATLEDPKGAAAMAERARADLVVNFSTDAMLKRLASLYEGRLRA